MSERVYVEGDVWEDRDGDEWEVVDTKLHHVRDAGGLGVPYEPEYVERKWGPLVLKKPAEDNYTEVAMADWEKELLDNGFKTNPHVPYNAAYPQPDGEVNWMNAADLDEIFMFQVASDIVSRLDSVFVGHAVGVYEEALGVLLKKNADYGSKNIAESPGGALNGLRVRMWDKLARLVNLTDLGIEPENESLRDSFLDLLNYSAIALMVLDGKWPGSGES